MKEKYLSIILCLLFTYLSFSQDCTTQRIMSNDTSICLGQSTTISLLSSELGITYQLRDGATNIGLPVLGTGGLINFNVSPATTTTYSVYVTICGLTYNDTCTVTVNPIPDVIATNDNQTICSNNALATMVLSGSVSGTSYNWTRNNTVNVTGIANSGSGNIAGTLVNTTNSPQTVTFTITPTANGCSGSSIIASVLVNPTPNAVASNNNQTICSNNAIATMVLSGNVSGTTYNWTRNNTVNVTGIANSGSGNIAGTLVNTTNSPQTVTFTITPTANGCSGSAITASVLVNPTPNAVASNNNQTICSNNAIASMVLSGNVLGTTYNWTRNNTVNVTGIANSGSGNIAGTLVNTTNSPQTVTFTITPTANGCSGSSITASVLVNPTPNAVASNNNQTICSNNAIATMVLSGNVSGTSYNWTRNNTVNVTGIANSGSGNIAGTLVNTTNSPQTVTFTITPTANGCSGSSITASVLVNPTPNAVASNNNQTICSNNAIATMVLSGNVSGTSYNWTRNNTINVTGIANSGSGNITGTLVNTTNSPQTVTFTITPTANGCSGSAITASVLVEAQTIGGNVTITAPGVSPSSNIFTHCHVGNGTLYLSNYVGNIIRWESSADAGLNWISISNTQNTYNYTGILKSTLFRAVIQNGPFCNIQYSTASMINVIPNIKPSPVTATPAIICNGDSSVLYSESGYATSQYLASGGTFQSANPSGWLADGCGNCLNAGMSNTNPGGWQLSATNGGTYSGVKYTSQGKFVIANGNFNSYLETPVFNTFGLTTAQLTFNHAFRLMNGANAYVQISINGGPYNTILQFNGPQNKTPSQNFHTTPVQSIDLSYYIGQPNLRVRFYYQGTVGSSWAIDNIEIPDVPVNLQTQWVDAVTGAVISNAQTLTVSPSTTTTYAITSFLNGCNSFGTNGTAYVTVTVNQRPTAVISQDQIVCLGGTASFSIDLTGTPPWRVTYNDGTSNTTVSNIMSSPYTFNVPNITTDKTYTINAVDDNNCTAIPSDYIGQATVTVLDGTPGLWTGLVSNDWFDCMNWDGGLPTINIDAIIPAGSSNMPLIDPSTSPYAAMYGNMASARDLNINTGASLTMAANSNLQINRNWINSGIFNPGQGNVSFIGSATNQIQTINQGINLKEVFYDLTLNNGINATGISLPDQFELTVRNLLTLTRGTLRLNGEAQLIQNGTVPNPMSGNGYLLIDQQGKSSSYHYNYWCSPVSLNGANYTINDILRSGSNSASNPFSPGTISYGSGIYYADGAYSDPIKLSTRWMYKYSAMNPSYFNWQHISNTGTINIGEGYIMKGVTGTASINDLQNYTFMGKPNNGNINLSIGAGQEYLIGNPYPSALDANQFILDNIKDNGGSASTNIINGALYFWDHFGAQTHYLAQYIGGYATYTLMGGVVAVSNDPLINNNNASGTKVPKRYIPVAQGFFVKAYGDASLSTNNPNMTSPITGGTIQIKNSQRAFERESGSNSTFFRNSNEVASFNTSIDQRMKIRFGIETDNGYRRQILLGADNNTTSMFDIGYDAPMIDVQGDDFYWDLNNVPLIIQAIENFNVGQFIPVTVKLTNANSFTLTIDQLENIDSNVNIYLYDNVSGIFFDLRNSDVTLNLGQGLYSNRFSITFHNTILNENNDVVENSGDLQVYVDNTNDILHIKNNKANTKITEIYLFDILGKLLRKWEVKESAQSNLEYTLSNLSDGTHIIKLITNNGELSSKVIID